MYRNGNKIVIGSFFLGQKIICTNPLRIEYKSSGIISVIRSTFERGIIYDNPRKIDDYRCVPYMGDLNVNEMRLIIEKPGYLTNEN